MSGKGYKKCVRDYNGMAAGLKYYWLHFPKIVSIGSQIIYKQKWTGAVQQSIISYHNFTQK